MFSGIIVNHHYKIDISTKIYTKPQFRLDIRLKMEVKL